MKYPTSIQKLIDEFTHLPTVGPKTAERYVFYLLKQTPEFLQRFAQNLAELKENTTTCKTCLAISETNPCSICSDNKRDDTSLCIVANSQDMLVIDSSKQYSGKYFILGGVINTIENITPDKLNVKLLINKIRNNNQIKEIILALNPTLEGETTSMYLSKLLSSYNIKITRLARGLPMGADLEYADEMTISNALKFRNEM